MKCTAFTNSAEKSILSVSKSKVVKLALFVVILMAAGSFSASAQIFVTVRPAHHAVVRPAHGPRGAVWIDEEWENRGGHYVETGGHWATPPHPGWIWVGGHWAHERRGDYWIAGKWRKA
jgi:hypothetical protein